MTSTFGRADMLLAYVTGGEAALRDAARRLGMEEQGADDDAKPSAASASPMVPMMARAMRDALPPRAPAPAESNAAKAEELVPFRAASLMPNAESWRRLERRLTETLAQASRGGRADTAELTEATASGRSVSSLRRRVVERWPRELLLVLDGDDQLAPLWRDQTRLAEKLARRLGRCGIAVERSVSGLFGSGVRTGRVSPSAPILAVTGWTDVVAGVMKLHEMAGRQTGLRGRRVATLGAGPELDDAAGSVEMIRWGRAAATPLERASAEWVFEHVLAVPAFVEPGVLRELRLASSMPGADLTTELEVWSRFDHQDGENRWYEPARRTSRILVLREAMTSDDKTLDHFIKRAPGLVPEDNDERMRLASTLRTALDATLKKLGPFLQQGATSGEG